MSGLIFIAIAVVAGLLAWIFGTKKVQELEKNASKIPSAVRQWENKVNTYARRFNVPADIAMAVLWQESTGDKNEMGSAGEIGLMQLKPIAVKDVRQNMDVNTSGWKINPDTNIKVGIAYLKLWYKRFNSWDKAIKFYNQGAEGAKKNPQKAQNYLNKVEAKRKFFV